MQGGCSCRTCSCETCSTSGPGEAGKYWRHLCNRILKSSLSVSSSFVLDNGGWKLGIFGMVSRKMLSLGDSEKIRMLFYDLNWVAQTWDTMVRQAVVYSNKVLRPFLDMSTGFKEHRDQPTRQQPAEEGLFELGFRAYYQRHCVFRTMWRAWGRGVEIVRELDILLYISTSKLLLFGLYVTPSIYFVWLS